jgi:hypothetical protein
VTGGEIKVGKELNRAMTVARSKRLEDFTSMRAIFEKNRNICSIKTAQ